MLDTASNIHSAREGVKASHARGDDTEGFTGGSETVEAIPGGLIIQTIAWVSTWFAEAIELLIFHITGSKIIYPDCTIDMSTCHLHLPCLPSVSFHLDIFLSPAPRSS